MIRIVLCDDDNVVIEKYRYLIKRYAMSRGMEVELSSFSRGEDLIFELTDHYEEPDIIFLDVFMDELNGVEVAKQIRAMGYNSQIIFLTSSSDYVFDAFDVGSLNYLIKQDTDDTRFRTVLGQVLTQIDKRSGDFFDCNFGAESRRIPFKDISHFEIYRRVMRVHFNNDEYFDFYETMDHLTTRLANRNFVRVHRSYLVNLNHIVLFKNQTLRLENGEELPIGKAYQSDVKQSFNEFVEKNWE
ncbi:LytTR family DNA-binding domain-containing protein [Erysipelothrix rhusiopathiae]|uniref:LytR/AlgR family response regulator transcription factor n=1 Tax=Erysipelothrix rhusiopathiae TaxID=1648 RepID=UPI002B255321|nr:LytTR family DNA-binding domain-containing protein [Erysipelothrix rhusiopathiae]WRB93685.1 LytTR family DNA-binding domain-containing protein [Erysipelothrix rhusiopathiae]